MTKRPYIACALSAALAAKNHGFRFYDGKDALYGEIIFTAHSEALINIYYQNGYRNAEISDWQKWHFIQTKNIYIHPLSLHLLEPVDDDLLEVGNCEYFLVAPLKYVQKYEKTMITQDNAKSLLENSVARIVLRNNLPFPAIEWREE